MEEESATLSVKHLRVERNVPLGLIAILVSQTILFASFIARMDQRISELETHVPDAQRVAVLEVNVANNLRNIEDLERRTVKSLDEIKIALREISRKLDDYNKEPDNGSNKNFP